MVSNVAGPPFPLYSAGAKMVRYYGLGLLTPGVGLFHLIYSACGVVTMSILGDRDSMPDPAFYRQCAEEAFADLLAAVKAAEKADAEAAEAAKKKPAPKRAAGKAKAPVRKARSSKASSSKSSEAAAPKRAAAKKTASGGKRSSAAKATAAKADGDKVSSLFGGSDAPVSNVVALSAEK